ncbi:unnamed protein product [Prunus armeniaca]
MKQQALDKKQGVDKNTKSGRSAQTKPKSSSDAKAEKEDHKNNVTKGKKRKNDLGAEKDTVSLEKLVKIQIPPTLRKQLVDDWEFISQQDKLVKLPRSPTVDDILQKYLDYRTKKDGKESLLAMLKDAAPIKLPELLAYVNIEEETQTLLQQKLLNFLKFLQKNQSTFFLSAYDGSKSVEGKGKGKHD